MNMRRKLILLLVGTVLLVGSKMTFSHCEIPCGIYDDPMRIKMIAEDIRTIEKSMNQIIALSKETPINYNQLVRWITNKEDHANRIQDTVCQYFMAQRITPTDSDNAEAYGKYVTQLTLLHKMHVHAMKCKQTTDLAHIKTLRTLLDAFETSYFGQATAKSHTHHGPHGHEH